VFSNHCCHRFLVRADRPDLLMAELVGRVTGVRGGRGGSQHLCYNNFYSNGVSDRSPTFRRGPSSPVGSAWEKTR